MTRKIVGYVTALGAGLLLSGIVGGIVGAILGTGSATESAAEGGVASIIGLLITLLLAFLIGGYAAGRMAGRSGLKLGLLVALLYLLITVVLAHIGAAIGTDLINFSGVSYASQRAFRYPAGSPAKPGGHPDGCGHPRAARAVYRDRPGRRLGREDRPPAVVTRNPHDTAVGGAHDRPAARPVRSEE